MSFNELVVAAQALAPTEKQRLISILTEENLPEGVPPEFFLPGAVLHMGSQITTDEEGLKKFYEFAGMNIEE